MSQSEKVYCPSVLKLPPTGTAAHLAPVAEFIVFSCFPLDLWIKPVFLHVLSHSLHFVEKKSCKELCDFGADDCRPAVCSGFFQGMILLCSLEIPTLNSLNCSSLSVCRAKMCK